MGSKKESFTQSRNIFQTTQAKINTPRNFFSARQQSIQLDSASHNFQFQPLQSNAWENSYLDTGCINNFQSLWYGSKHGFNFAANTSGYGGYNRNGGFVCNNNFRDTVSNNTTNNISSNCNISTINSTMSMTTNSIDTDTPYYDHNVLSQNGHSTMNINNPMETEVFNIGLDQNNDLDIIPTIESDNNSQMESLKMITDLKNHADEFVDYDDPNDILSKINSFPQSNSVETQFEKETRVETEDFSMECDSSVDLSNNGFFIYKNERETDDINQFIDSSMKELTDDIYDFNIPSITAPECESLDLKATYSEHETNDENSKKSIMQSNDNQNTDNQISKSILISGEEEDKNITETDEPILVNTSVNPSSLPPENDGVAEVIQNIDEYLDENGDTPLHVAIHRQDVNACLEILQRPEAVHIKDLRNKSNEVPILLAMKRFADQYSLLLDKLLELRSNVDVHDQSGNNIFHLLLHHSRNEQMCFNLLTILFAHSENTDKYRTLMSKRNVDGYCATHLATIKRYDKTVKLMFENGADLNLQDNKAKRTCIVLAAEDKNWELVTLMLEEMNVDVNIPTNANLRAVNYAIKQGEVNMIELLFKHRTDVYKWKEPSTPSDIVLLVERLIRKKRRQRQKKGTQVERPA